MSKKYYKLSEEKNKEIINLYLHENKTYKDIAEIYNVSRVMVGNILRKNNINPAYRRGFYNVNHSYFENIDTPEKAYFLGLFHADGCNTNSGLKISLQEEDKYILDCLKNSIEYSGVIRIVKREGNRKNQAILNIVCKKLAEDLKKLNYYPNKTFNVTYPYFIEQSIQKHFIRGVFDGDGCLWNGNNNEICFSIVGTKSTLIGIELYIKNIIDNKIKCNICESKTKGIFRLTITKKISIFKVLEHLYNDSNNFFIQRKKILFDYLFIEKQVHLFNKIYCKNIDTNEITIFDNLKKCAEYFGLKTPYVLSYCILKSKKKIYKNKYYLNKLRNEKIEV